MTKEQRNTTIVECLALMVGLVVVGVVLSPWAFKFAVFNLVCFMLSSGVIYHKTETSELMFASSVLSFLIVAIAVLFIGIAVYQKIKYGEIRIDGK